MKRGGTVELSRREAVEPRWPSAAPGIRQYSRSVRGWPRFFRRFLMDHWSGGRGLAQGLGRGEGGGRGLLFECFCKALPVLRVFLVPLLSDCCRGRIAL